MSAPAIKPSTERRFQRTVSRLQKQIKDLKASRDHFRRLSQQTGAKS